MLRTASENGMREYTPTYRGFDSFYGYLRCCSRLYSHFTEVAPRWSRHCSDCTNVFKGLDFRNNTAPLTNEKGHYSTHLFTKIIEDIITNHSIADGPFFIYAAYQSVHAPLEVPQEYIDEWNYISHDYRRTFCGMLRVADEGLANITNRLQEKDLLDNTIIIFTTDNGGQTYQGSSNWPLRGNKGTVFEGGVHGTAFVWALSYPNWIMITINYSM